MSSGMIILNQSINIMQNYTTWTEIALLCILKLKMFKTTLQMMLKKDLICEIMKLTDHCQKAKMKTLLN